MPTVLYRSVTPEPYLQSSPVICSLCPLSAVLANYLQPPPITCRARPSSGVTRQVAPSERPAVPARPSRAAIRTDVKIPVRPGHPFRYRRPSHPDWTLGNTAATRFSSVKGQPSQASCAPAGARRTTLSGIPNMCCKLQARTLHL